MNKEYDFSKSKKNPKTKEKKSRIIKYCERILKDLKEAGIGNDREKD